MYYADKFKSCIGDSRQTYHLLKETSGRKSHSKKISILSSCYEADQSPSLGDVAWQKSSINILSMYLIIIVSQSITCLLFPIQTMTSLYIYNRSQHLKLRSSLIAWLTKHHGDDGLSIIIIKLSAPVTVRIMTHIIKCSFNYGFFPESLKNAKILPLHKEGGKLEENNYRPI